MNKTVDVKCTAKKCEAQQFWVSLKMQDGKKTRMDLICSRCGNRLSFGVGK
jgi:hypothetical protein